MTRNNLLTIYLLLLQILKPQYTTAWYQINIEIGDNEWFYGPSLPTPDLYKDSNYFDLSQCYRTPNGRATQLKGIAIWNRYNYDKYPTVRAIGFYSNPNCNILTQGNGKYEIRSIPYVVVTLAPAKLAGISVINLVDAGVEDSARSWKVIDLEKERQPGGILADVPDTMLGGSILIWRGEGDPESPTGQQGWELVTGGITHIDPGAWNHLSDSASLGLYLREMAERVLTPGWIGIEGAAQKSARIESSLLINLKYGENSKPELQDAPELEESVPEPYSSLELAKPYTAHPFISVKPAPGIEFQGRPRVSTDQLNFLERRIGALPGPRPRRTPEEEQLDLALASLISEPLASLRRNTPSESAIRNSMAAAGNRDWWMAGLILQWEYVTAALIAGRKLYYEQEFGSQQSGPGEQQLGIGNRPGQLAQLADQLNRFQDQLEDQIIPESPMLIENPIASEKEIQTEAEIEPYSNRGTQTEPVEGKRVSQAENPTRLQLEMYTQTDPLKRIMGVQTEEQLQPQSDMETQTEPPVRPETGIQTEDRIQPEMGMQTDDPMLLEFGMQTERPIQPEVQIQTEEFIMPEAGVQTERPGQLDIELQTEDLPETGMQTERPAQGEMEIQTEEFIRPEIGMQTERPINPEAQIQTEDFIMPEAGVQTERPAQLEIELQTEEQPEFGIQTERPAQAETEIQTEQQPELGIQTERPAQAEMEIQTDQLIRPGTGVQTENQIPEGGQRDAVQQTDPENSEAEPASPAQLFASEQSEPWPDIQIQIQQNLPYNVRIQPGNIISFDDPSEQPSSREQSEASAMDPRGEYALSPSSRGRSESGEIGQPGENSVNQSAEDGINQSEAEVIDQAEQEADEIYRSEARSESSGDQLDADSLYEPSEKSSRGSSQYVNSRNELEGQRHSERLLERPLQREEQEQPDEEIQRQSEVRIQSDIDDENLDYQVQMETSPPLILFGMQAPEDADIGIQNADFSNSLSALRDFDPQSLDQNELRRLLAPVARSSPATSPPRDNPNALLETVPREDPSDYLVKKLREAGLEPGAMSSIDFPGESFTEDDYGAFDEDLVIAGNSKRQRGFRSVLPDLGLGTFQVKKEDLEDNSRIDLEDSS
ncbi:hypothetical protein TWF506_007533 [Arthrobotrys conoides]|uniref:Uncharacterized protein n=1 Tax=Arthrobotrys conoides TaxID=74498 RepID=A0AAN8RSW8_9PEZI